MQTLIKGSRAQKKIKISFALKFISIRREQAGTDGHLGHLKKIINQF
jgi:hypothetical protein